MTACTTNKDFNTVLLLRKSLQKVQYQLTVFASVKRSKFPLCSCFTRSEKNERKSKVINNRSRSEVGVWFFFLGTGMDSESRFCQKTGAGAETEFNVSVIPII